MTAPAPQCQPIIEHLAKYLAEREPDSHHDIDVVFTSVQRDAFVEILNSHATLTARIAELEAKMRKIEGFADNCVNAERYTTEDALNDLQDIRAVIVLAALQAGGAKG